ncbi:MAG: desulfoferrodoxin [Candidatus Parcubacteria bacterium]|nr:desulfoferrodoxin [Candidatus Parcubacteria bacterium]
MIIKSQIYKCSACGNMVEVVNVDGGQLSCCGQPMILQEPKAKDAEGKEKHVPVIEKTKEGYMVKIGSIPHPMEEVHYIQWIEIIADEKSYKTFLKPGDKPETKFCLQAEKIIARAYCNIHGLWQNNS